MKKPLLKILPGVVAILITPSCSKDNDIIDEDNAALVAEEQVIKNQVFHLKVQNKSSLSKMKMAGWDKEGKCDLKFEIGDKLNIEFTIKQIDINSSDFEFEEFTLYGEGTCIKTNGLFAFAMDDIRDEEGYYNNDLWKDAAKHALTDMQNNASNAATDYKVKLTWGDNYNLLDNKSFEEYETLSKMFANVPRLSEESFTLQPNSNYCFLVFEGGCSKTVTIDNKTIKNTMCYIVKPDAIINVSGKEGTTNTITAESGKLYYVRCLEGDVNATLKNPDAGTINEINL